MLAGWLAGRRASVTLRGNGAEIDRPRAEERGNIVGEGPRQQSDARKPLCALALNKTSRRSARLLAADENAILVIHSSGAAWPSSQNRLAADFRAGHSS